MTSSYKTVKIQPTQRASETDILRHQLAAALQELEVIKNELREAQDTIKSLSEQLTEPTAPNPAPPQPQRTAPIGILYEWLDARFVRGRYGWPDDVRLHPEDKTTNENINHLATWQVCKEVVVIPDTKDANCSYADWLLHHASDEVKGEQRLPLVGKATHFVSHAWGFEFQHLLRALRNFVVNTCTDEERNKGIYLWIDIFVVDQHAAARGEMGDDYWETAFREMVDAIGHTVLVLDRLPAITPTVLTRIWCVWELYSTVNNKKNRLSITMDSELNNMYKSCKRKELMEEMLNVISAIRSQDAEATVDSDRIKINALIQATEGGHAAVDRCVCRVLYALLLSMAARTLEDSNDIHLEAFRALSEKTMNASSSSGALMLTQRFHGRNALVWSLTLDKPKMSSILQDMGYVCDDVEVLNMSGYRTTKIERLPDGLLGGQLECLRSLYLSNHKLNDVPLTFGTALPHLVHLDLSENLFVTIPVTLLKLKQLQILNMANNQLSKNTFENLVEAIPSTLQSNEGNKAIRLTLWPSLILLDIRLNDDLDNTTPDTLRMQIPSLKNVLFHTEPRERAIAILLNRFQSQGDLGLATAGDVKEINDPGSGDTLFYVAMTPGSAMQGWGKKALVANLRMKRAFLTQMGFHRVYWERNGLKHLGEPMSDEIGHPSGSGSRQIFERGNLNWLPEKGCFISEKEEETEEKK